MKKVSGGEETTRFERGERCDGGVQWGSFESEQEELVLQGGREKHDRCERRESRKGGQNAAEKRGGRGRWESRGGPVVVLVEG